MHHEDGALRVKVLRYIRVLSQAEVEHALADAGHMTVTDATCYGKVCQRISSDTCVGQATNIDTREHIIQVVHRVHLTGLQTLQSRACLCLQDHTTIQAPRAPRQPGHHVF